MKILKMFIMFAVSIFITMNLYAEVSGYKDYYFGLVSPQVQSICQGEGLAYFDVSATVGACGENMYNTKLYFVFSKSNGELWLIIYNLGNFSTNKFKQIHEALESKYGLDQGVSEEELSDFDYGLTDKVQLYYGNYHVFLFIKRNQETNEPILEVIYSSKQEKPKRLTSSDF